MRQIWVKTVNEYIQLKTVNCIQLGVSKIEGKMDTPALSRAVKVVMSRIDLLSLMFTLLNTCKIMG